MTDDEMTPEQIETQRKFFKEFFFEDSNRFGQHAVSSGQNANKSIFFANGGAILALLTFIGDGGSPVEKVAIFWSFVCFAVGVAAALAAQISMYRSQARFASMSYLVAITIDQGADPTTDLEVARHETAGKRWIAANLVLSSASLVSFLIGAFIALDAIT